MEQLYQEIFKVAESCRREGINGMAIDAREFLRQKNDMEVCITKIIAAMQASSFDSHMGDGTPEEYAFAYALAQHTIKYSMARNQATYLEKNSIKEYIKYGKYLISNIKDVEFNEGNFSEITKQHNMLDRMREYCFVFCLASIDVYAPIDSIETNINKAVVFDSIRDGEALRETCAFINKLCEVEPTYDIDLLWECGNLNFKISDYETSLNYFYLYVTEYIKQKSITHRTQDTKGAILDACYRIAYCYEFTDEISVALYIFAKIFKLNDPNAYSAFSIFELEEIEKWLPESIQPKIKTIDSIIALCELPSVKDNKRKIEIYHGISHIINELVLYYPKTHSAPLTLKPSDLKHLLRMASRLMYAAACRDDLYFTCLGTNHSENNEFDDAIIIFKFILNQIRPDEKKEIHLRMELVFYLAHAYLHSGKYSDAENELAEFEKYCTLFNDKEGFAHLAIYRTYIMFNKAQNHFTLSIYEVKSALYRLERNKPSLYTTKKIQKEWERLHNFLLAFIALKELFDGTASNVLSLHMTIEYFVRCADNESLRDKLLFIQLKKKEHVYYKIDNGTYSDDTIYFVGDIALLEKESYLVKHESSDPEKYELGVPNNNNDGAAIPIVVLCSDNERDITWVKATLKGRQVYLFITSDVAHHFHNRQPADGYEVVVIADTDIGDLIKYAYLHLAYNAITKSFFESRLFLGLAPTKMTQFLYKFNIRKIQGLHAHKDNLKLLPMVAIKSRFTAISSKQKEIYSNERSKEEESKKLYDLINTVKSNDEAKNKLVASIYIPSQDSANWHWHYELKEEILLPGLTNIYTDDRIIVDSKKFYMELCDKPLSKDPYRISEKNILAFLNKKLKRKETRAKHVCKWVQGTDCAHLLFQPISHDDNDPVRQFVSKLLNTVTMFDTDIDKIESMLAVKLNTNTYFVTLFNSAINLETWTETAKSLVGSFFRLTQESKVDIKQSISDQSDQGLYNQEGFLTPELDGKPDRQSNNFFEENLMAPHGNNEGQPTAMENKDLVNAFERVELLKDKISEQSKIRIRLIAALAETGDPITVTRHERELKNCEGAILDFSTQLAEMSIQFPQIEIDTYWTSDISGICEKNASKISQADFDLVKKDLVEVSRQMVQDVSTKKEESNKLNVLSSDLLAKKTLELTIPIIPALLSYKVEISRQTMLNLKNVFLKLFKLLKKETGE